MKNRQQAPQQQIHLYASDGSYHCAHSDEPTTLIGGVDPRVEKLTSIYNIGRMRLPTAAAHDAPHACSRLASWAWQPCPCKRPCRQVLQSTRWCLQGVCRNQRATPRYCDVSGMARLLLQAEAGGDNGLLPACKAAPQVASALGQQLTNTAP
jgi:hypothetical protein